MQTARATAVQIAAHSPLAILATKVSLNYSRDHTTQEGLDHVAQMNSLFLQSPGWCIPATPMTALPVLHLCKSWHAHLACARVVGQRVVVSPSYIQRQSYRRCCFLICVSRGCVCLCTPVCLALWSFSDCTDVRNAMIAGLTKQAVSFPKL